MDTDDLTSWPADVRAIFAAIGTAMGAGRLHPGVIGSFHGAQVVQGHEVKLRHLSKAELGDASGKYVIELSGDRWGDGAQWSFRSGELERLCRQAAKLNVGGKS